MALAAGICCISTSSCCRLTPSLALTPFAPFPCHAAGAAFDGTMHYDLPPERQTVMQQTAASSGSTLRQLAAEGGGTGGGAGAGTEQLPVDARQAAAAAALRRAGVAGPGPTSAQQPPLQEQQAAQQQQGEYSKGQTVLYRHRDGSMQQAKVRVSNMPAPRKIAGCCLACHLL